MKNTKESVKFDYADVSQLLPIIAKEKEAAKVRNSNELDGLRFFSDFSGEIQKAIGWLIENFYTGGKINIGRLNIVLLQIAQIINMRGFLAGVLDCNEYHKREGVKFVDCTQSSDKTLIAVGVLDEDYVDSDNDCYETAGGHRSYKALRGAMVKYYLVNRRDHRDAYSGMNLVVIKAEFESNLLEDHYNNNFCGVSTGNGTRRFEIGESIAVRSVIMDCEFLATWTKASKFKATVKKIDINKAIKLFDEYVPELVFVDLPAVS